ncbi:MAG: anti-sigma factor [Micromonosporaceae bacterium]|jgi:anti-sigma-K factor RskA|nr:anti-sigma factor [Micromonosporaceae bacterium]
MSTEIHALAGAYALDAVDDVERMAFARHLTGCEACRLEVAELRATAARLADTTWTAAPPRLRENVLRQAARTRQARPRSPGSPAGPAPSDRPGRWRGRVAAGIAAAALAAGAAGATFVVEERRVGSQRQAAQSALDQVSRIQSVMAAADAKARQIRVKGGGQVAVVYSRRTDAAVVMCADLARPSRDRAYQLWYVRDGQATSAGVLAGGQNAGTMLLPGLHGVEAVAISLEAAGGADRPTSRLATVPLA